METLARRRLLIASGFLLCLSLAVGCGKAVPPSTAASPAKVQSIAHEEDVNTIELTPEAEIRLGVVTAPVEMRPLARVRRFGAEITVPPGATMIVSAPVAGTLHAPPKGEAPKAGALVNRGQKLFELLPLLSPERAVLTPAEQVRFAEAKNAVATARIDASGLVQQGEVQVEAAQIALDRAERLLRVLERKASDQQDLAICDVHSSPFAPSPRRRSHHTNDSHIAQVDASEVRHQKC